MTIENGCCAAKTHQWYTSLLCTAASGSEQVRSDVLQLIYHDRTPHINKVMIYKVLAAARRGSPGEILVLSNLWAETPGLISPEDAVDVFLNHLNGDRVPQSMNNRFSDPANLAFTALLGLSKIGPFLGQRPALLARVAQAWMGIFKWSVYLFSGRIESADKSDPRRRASIDVISACWCAVGQYDSIREAMVSTPATIEIATRCWLEEDDGPIPSHVDAPVGTCVLGNLLKHATSAQLDRVLKMTGGKADEIAKLAISRLRGALTTRPVNATRLVIYLDFINSLSRVGTHPLRYALLGANVICPFFDKLDPDDLEMVLGVLGDILPRYCVYRSVIQTMDEPMRKIDGGAQKERVMRSIAKDVWFKFFKLECQAIGWIGGHKNACERIRQERMEGKPNRLSKSDNMFLHQIATCYARNNLPVLHEMAETDYSSTPRSHLVIRIDFTTQPVRFTLCPLAEYEVEPTPESIVVETQNETILAGVKENMGRYTLIESTVATGQTSQRILTATTGSFWEWDTDPYAERKDDFWEHLDFRAPVDEVAFDDLQDISQDIQFLRLDTGPLEERIHLPEAC
ncbi:predicted protein [Postia placenta Mad-698-R]|nr:predicted protein [Postia placenta Mad-698-R]